MKKTEAEKWNEIYSKNSFGFFPPAKVLHHYQHLLPKEGKALDMACGLGRNAVHLSRQGLDTYAIDISEVALSKLAEYAQQEDLKIHTQVFDLKSKHLQETEFDVIVISHFLDRTLIPDIKKALKEDGLIYYQTFTKLKLEDIGPSNPDYLLDRNELLHQFGDFQILAYREDADVGNVNEGFRNEAMLVAQK